MHTRMYGVAHLTNPLREAVRAFPAGYRTLAVSTFCSAAAFSGTVEILGLFLPALTAGLNLGASAVASALLAGTAVVAVAQPLIGSLTDRYGGRVVATTSLAVHSLGLFRLSAARGFPSLLFALLLIRVGAVGGVNLAIDATIAKWFVQTRGRAMALLRSALAVTTTWMLPLILSALSEGAGWRAALCFAGSFALAAVPVALLFLRRTPETVGLLPDGCVAAEPPDGCEASAGAGGGQQGATDALGEVQYTRAEALRTRCFWMLFGLCFAQTSANGAHSAMMGLIAQDAGLSLSQLSSMVLIPTAFAAFSANLGASAVIDRIDLRYCIVVSQVAIGIASAAAAVLLRSGSPGQPARAPFTCFVYGISYGVAEGLFFLVFKVALTRYFGRESAGAVMGAGNVALFSGIGLGPLFWGVIRDGAGSFEPALLFVASCSLPWAVAACFLRPPTKASATPSLAERAEPSDTDGLLLDSEPID